MPHHLRKLLIDERHDSVRTGAIVFGDEVLLQLDLASRPRHG
jgi:hypothetical protein